MSFFFLLGPMEENILLNNSLDINDKWLQDCFLLKKNIFVSRNAHCVRYVGKVPWLSVITHELKTGLMCLVIVPWAAGRVESCWAWCVRGFWPSSLPGAYGWHGPACTPHSGSWIPLPPLSLWPTSVQVRQKNSSPKK